MLDRWLSLHEQAHRQALSPEGTDVGVCSLLKERDGLGHTQNLHSFQRMT